MFSDPWPGTAQRAALHLFIAAALSCGFLPGQEPVQPVLDRIFADSRYQVDADFLRERAVPPPANPPDGSESAPAGAVSPRGGRAPADGRVRQPRSDDAGSDGWNLDAGNAFGWIALGVLFVLMVTGLLRLRAEARIPVFRRKKEARPEEPAAPPAEAGPWPQELDQAVSRGDWDGALRILLLAMIDRIPQQAGRAPRPWETGRRIAGWADLGPALKQAVARLVAAIEGSRFRGVPAREEEFRLCLAACEAMLDGSAESA